MNGSITEYEIVDYFRQNFGTDGNSNVTLLLSPFSLQIVHAMYGGSTNPEELLSSDSSSDSEEENDKQQIRTVRKSKLVLKPRNKKLNSDGWIVEDKPSHDDIACSENNSVKSKRTLIRESPPRQ